jgi:hypothetical protein
MTNIVLQILLIQSAFRVQVDPLQHCLYDKHEHHIPPLHFHFSNHPESGTVMKCYKFFISKLTDYLPDKYLIDKQHTSIG